MANKESKFTNFVHQNMGMICPPSATIDPKMILEDSEFHFTNKIGIIGFP